MISYASFLLVQGVDVLVVQDAMPNQLGLIAVIFLGAFLVLMGVRPVCFPKMKIVYFCLGVFLVMMGRMYFLDMGSIHLLDDPSEMVFIGDIIRIVGVLSMILGPLGICIPTRCKKIQEEREVEIIEV